MLAYISVHWESLPVKLNVREKDKYTLIQQSIWHNTSKIIHSLSEKDQYTLIEQSIWNNSTKLITFTDHY